MERRNVELEDKRVFHGQKKHGRGCRKLSQNSYWKEIKTIKLIQILMRKLLLFILISAIILMTPWIIISVSVQDRVYRDIETMPIREVGVVLGTTPGI